MQSPFYIVREIKKSDNAACQSLVQTYIMSFVSEAFWSCMFKEVNIYDFVYINKHLVKPFVQITLQLIVIAWAFLFIIMGLPLTWCVGAIPGVILLIYASINMSLFSKATEVANVSNVGASVLNTILKCIFFVETLRPILGR